MDTHTHTGMSGVSNKITDRYALCLLSTVSTHPVDVGMREQIKMSMSDKSYRSDSLRLFLFVCFYTYITVQFHSWNAQA